MLRAAFPAFSLPTNGQQLSLLLVVDAVDCTASQQEPRALLSLGSSPPVAAAIDCAQRRLLLTSPGLGRIMYALPEDAPAAETNASLALLLSLDQQQGTFAACTNGQPLAPLPGSSTTMLQRLAGSSPASLLGPAAVLGSSDSMTLAARADVAAAFVTDSVLSCEGTLPGERLQSLRDGLDAAAAASALQHPPTIAVVQQPVAAVVGQPLQLVATATPSSAAAGHAHRCAIPMRSSGLHSVC